MNVRSVFFGLSFVTLLVSLHLLHSYRPQPPVTKDVTFAFNEGFPSFSEESYRVISFGYQNVFSSLLWIRFLYNTPPRKVEKDSVSWIYLDLDAISKLDPDFAYVYHLGGIFLSVITEDKKGAQLILERGVQKFPDSGALRSYLAYHYQHELNMPLKAAEQYELAADLPGAPSYYASLAARLRRHATMTEAEIRQEKIAQLTRLLKTTPSEEVRQQIKGKIRALQEKMESP